MLDGVGDGFDGRLVLLVEEFEVVLGRSVVDRGGGRFDSVYSRVHDFVFVAVGESSISVVILDSHRSDILEQRLLWWEFFILAAPLLTAVLRQHFLQAYMCVYSMW